MLSSSNCISHSRLCHAVTPSLVQSIFYTGIIISSPTRQIFFKTGKHILFILPGALPFSHQGTVAAVFITVKSGYIGDNLRTQRVYVDVTSQFPEIDVFPADDGFIAVLKKLSVPHIPSIEIDHIPGWKTF